MTLSVNYSEAGSRDGSSTLGSYGWKGNGSLPRTIRVKWADRFTAMRQAVGYSYPYTSGGFRYLRRVLPEIANPFDSTMRCINARIVKGEHWTGRNAYDPATGNPLAGMPNKTATKDDDGNPTDSYLKYNEYKYALISLDYAQANYNLYDDAYVDGPGAGSEFVRFLSYNEDREVRGLTIMGGVLYWVRPEEADPKKRSIQFSVPKIMFQKTLKLVQHQFAVDALPLSTIDSYIATVNKFDMFGGLYPAGTLLMMPPMVERYVMPNGLIGADVTHTWGYVAEGHNKLLLAEAGQDLGFRWVTSDATIVAEPTPGTLVDGKWLFGERDFNQVWFPNNP